MRQLLKVRGWDAGDFGRALESPLRSLFPQQVCAGRVRVQERLVGVAVFEEIAVHGQRDDDVRAWFDREMQVRRARLRSGARIDYHQLRAVFLRLADVRDRVNFETPGFTPQRMRSRPG